MQFYNVKTCLLTLVVRSYIIIGYINCDWSVIGCKQKVYLYVFNTMSDWEYGYLIAELNSGRYFKKI